MTFGAAAVWRMMRVIALCAAALAQLLPLPALADPVELKLAFFFSEDTDTFRYGVKPFVDAVNAEGQGVVSIKVYADGKLGNRSAEQSQLVLSGVADIAFVVPGQTPYRFPDNDALELPGLFRDAREGTLVYTKLIAAGALLGYENFFVIGAYAAAPGVIHSRNPVKSLADFGGLKVRTNTPLQAEALIKFGAIPTVMPAALAANALAKGAIDAVILSPAGLYQFGGPLAKNHYLLPIGAAPLVLLMNPQRFAGLPEAAKTIIRKYSGDRAAAAWIEFYGDSETRSLKLIKSDPERRVVEPSAADRDAARRVYDSMTQAYAAKSPRNAALVHAIEADLAAIREGKR